ncbi:MAG: hypothetical protein Q8916_06680 [Bacteroidota bacterium]|nr:hypothetical protein [Bacteroidota bacterium]MDP4230076.1 hypothetical protein [Bacteroidota bacterium]MDP4235739.1 hypothetical protein [Bacteroidota bacterium]
MNSYSIRNTALILVCLLLSSASWAQTADEMAKELEKLYSQGEGTTISFTLDGEKNSLTFASGSGKFRIENPRDLIISDGTTIWHLDKTKKEVVLDKADSKSGSLSNVQELVKFSSNYSGTLTKKHNTFELALTPSKDISKVLESVGGISMLKFSFTRSPKSGIIINKITARAAMGDVAIANIKMQTVKKLKASSFTYSPPKGTKIIDLRE